MAKLILTSDGIDSLPIEKEFRKSINKNTKVAILSTAKEGPNKTDSIKRHFNLLTKLFNPKEVYLIDFAEGVDTANSLLDYDFVYILGGNPFRLQFYLNKERVNLFLT